MATQSPILEPRSRWLAGYAVHSEGRSTRLGRLDFVLLTLMVLYSVSGSWRGLGYTGGPGEDGAMLLRYSQHLADGHGLTWNVGQAPVEGATDFLYMVAVAAVARIGHLGVVVACQRLLFVCWILLGATIFLGIRRMLGGNRWLALAASLYICSAGEMRYLSTFFGAPFMMLMVSLTWVVGTGLIARRLQPTLGNNCLFSGFALLIALTRPEGNILAVLLLAAVVFSLGLQASTRLIATFTTVFVLLGGSYFAWRWHYFGYPLPNPFYVKGGGGLHIQGLFNAVENVFKILFALVPLLALGLRNRIRQNLLLTLAIPVLGYTLIWVLLSPENNHLFRFQMPVLPVTLLFLPLLLDNVGTELGLTMSSLKGRGALAAAATWYVLMCCVAFNREFGTGMDKHTSGMEFAAHLSQYADRGYTMAVTEAGQFPLFSRWNAIDTLGLNDAHIAHYGIDEAYLDESKPELIMYHLYPPTLTGDAFHSDALTIGKRDMHAIQVMHNYALDHHYILAAAYGGEPCSLNVFYVKPNTPDTDAIVSYLRNTTYYFLDNGILSVDFRNGLRPECALPKLKGGTP